jgi:hypothetical protein
VDLLFAIPPPVLSGSGSRVEGLWPSSQPDVTRLPVQLSNLGKFIPGLDPIIGVYRTEGLLSS